MDTEEKWIASELVKTEMLLALRHGAVSPHHYDAIARSFRSDWESFYVIPLDSKCQSVRPIWSPVWLEDGRCSAYRHY